MNDLATDLADIIEPVPPVVASSAAVAWIVACVVLLALIAGLAVWWRRGAARRRALRQMRRLRREFARGGISTRELAYDVAAELRSCLRARRLHCAVAPVAYGPAQQQSWRDLITRLDALRYQPGTGLDAAQVERLLRDSAFWLRRAR